MAEAEELRSSPAVSEARTLAPGAFAHADRLQKQAERAYADGDTVGAGFLSERAATAYEHAAVLARVARAEARIGRAKIALGEAQDKLAGLEAEHTKAAAETRDLEMRARVIKDAEALAPVGPADAARERARLAATRSLALDARLLCAAAAMLDPKAQGIEAARTAAQQLGTQLSTDVKPAPIEAAMRARAECLTVLTAARRAKAGLSSTGRADELVAQLSATGDLAPWRDDRGVVVTLRDLFSGASLTDEAATRIGTLGKVALAHPQFPVQVVVHGPKSGAGPKSEAEREKERAEAVAKVLADAGLPPEMLQTHVAGGAHPVAMPGAAKAAARNERVEIIFVDPGG
jgi:hypothetical protein